MSSGKDNSRYVIASVAEAFKVLEVVANSREALSVADIARALHITGNTAFRYCVSLAEVGAIAEVGDGYKLGMKLALYWAKKKASLEAERDRVERDIQALHITEE